MALVQVCPQSLHLSFLFCLLVHKHFAVRIGDFDSVFFEGVP